METTIVYWGYIGLYCVFEGARVRGLQGVGLRNFAFKTRRFSTTRIRVLEMLYSKAKICLDHSLDWGLGFGVQSSGFRAYLDPPM